MADRPQPEEALLAAAHVAIERLPESAEEFASSVDALPVARVRHDSLLRHYESALNDLAKLGAERDRLLRVMVQTATRLENLAGRPGVDFGATSATSTHLRRLAAILRQADALDNAQERALPAEPGDQESPK